MNTIEFPGLWGLKMEVNRVAFEVFGLPIYWYGIIIATGFLLAVLLAIRDSRKFGFEPDNILDLVLFAAPVAIVTARLFFVIFSWSQFKDNPIDIINTRKGGLAIYGGVIGALIVGYLFAHRRKLSGLKLLDLCTPFLVLAQGIGRWGNFVNQEAFGTATALPWRMNSQTVNAYLNTLPQGYNLKQWGVHPTFLYESLWDIAVFAFLMWYRKRKKLDGEVFFLYMVLYGAGRVFIEGLRTDSLMVGNLRISQVLAGLFAVAFAVLFYLRRRKREKAIDEEPVEIGQSEYGSLLARLNEEEEHPESREVHSGDEALQDTAEEAGEPAECAESDEAGEPEEASEPDEAGEPAESAGPDKSGEPEAAGEEEKDK